tara:strand:+ start:327 stop:692 length:366 start_codon:yes stop_codon:yes gene_type:complete
MDVPQDKKPSIARVNWLLWQLKKCEFYGCYVRTNWLGSNANTSYLVSNLIADPSPSIRSYPNSLASSRSRLRPENFTPNQKGWRTKTLSPIADSMFLKYIFYKFNALFEKLQTLLNKELHV